MQVFRLIQPGVVDKVIAFDELPNDLIAGINKKEPIGLPRHWREFAPEFYLLDYIGTNNDKEKWAKIVAFVRQNVDTSFRIMDKLEDMAKPMAPNSKDAMELEPEDVTIIPLPKAKEKEPEVSDPAKLKRGRKMAGTGA